MAFLDRVEIVLAQRDVMRYRAVARDQAMAGYLPPAPEMPDLPLAAARAVAYQPPTYLPWPEPLAELEAELQRRWR